MPYSGPWRFRQLHPSFKGSEQAQVSAAGSTPSWRTWKSEARRIVSPDSITAPDSYVGSFGGSVAALGHRSGCGRALIG
jgi:hypothetical protein